eukprot:4483607-Prymnesium_polylepis.1
MCGVFCCGESWLQRPVHARSCAICAWAVGHARIRTSMGAHEREREGPEVAARRSAERGELEFPPPLLCMWLQYMYRPKSFFSSGKKAALFSSPVSLAACPSLHEHVHTHLSPHHTMAKNINPLLSRSHGHSHPPSSLPSAFGAAPLSLISAVCALAPLLLSLSLSPLSLTHPPTRMPCAHAPRGRPAQD